MTEPRKTDEVLEQVRAEQQLDRRGKLKIFFGYAAGVGKTYSMLEAARAQHKLGVNLLVGYVEPHGRPETEALLADLPALPTRQVEHRGVTLQEFDLEAVLARHPALILVDELAHTNAPTLRHAKRWQDVEDLIAAGIDVYTTLNVQHLESLNDIITQITGVVVRETLPDAVFERADEVELVDLPPDDLLVRLREGKIYIAAQAERAMDNFFRRANLIALRELALRLTADRVHVQVQTARRERAADLPWATHETLLVCFGSSPSSAKIIRAAKRMASGLQAPWIAAHIETSRDSWMSRASRLQLLRNHRLAEQLGAETITLSGDNVADEVINYARSRNVTKILVGKPHRSRWIDLLRGSLVAALLRRSGDIDVYVTRGSEEVETARIETSPRPSIRWHDYGSMAAIILACTGLAAFLQWRGLREINTAMVYFLGLVLVAARYGRGPGVAASVLSILLFDFFLVDPRFSFAVSDTQYLLTFAVMLLVALVISTLTSRFRIQAESSRHRERNTEALYQLTRELAGRMSTRELVATAEKLVQNLYGGRVAILLPDEKGLLKPPASPDGAFAAGENERAVAQWTLEHRKPAGSGTDTLPHAAALYLPLVGAQQTVGVIGLANPRTEDGGPLPPDRRQLLEALVQQAALAVERHLLAEQAEKVLMQIETERLRGSLLSSVSHDLRTPLAVIAGASSTLLEKNRPKDLETQRDLLYSIYDEAERMTRLVENVLHITRLESGAMVLSKQAQPLEEVLSSVLVHMEKTLQGRPLNMQFVDTLPLVQFDGIMIEQVLANLLDNAVKYTPAGSPIDIIMGIEDNEAVIEVADRGPGLKSGEEQLIFEKFVRGSAGGSEARRGAGLGLAICRAIIQAHGGRIWAANRPGGGARFLFTLPVGEAPQDEATEPAVM
jgi:two-component system sensor histidine kinase KdpD